MYTVEIVFVVVEKIEVEDLDKLIKYYNGMIIIFRQMNK